MLACVVKSGRTVSGSDGPLRSQLFFKLRRERARVFNLLGPGDEADRELAARLGVTLERVRRMNQRLDARDVAVDEHLAAPQDQERELFEHQLGQSLGYAVRRALAELDPRERGIMEQRYLNDGDEQLSLAEIARRLRISRERARQLEQRAFSKLRRRLGSTTDPVLRDWLEQEVVTTAA
jgi:RNA polymerase sigma-32 factor